MSFRDENRGSMEFGSFVVEEGSSSRYADPEAGGVRPVFKTG